MEEREVPLRASNEMPFSQQEHGHPAQYCEFSTITYDFPHLLRPIPPGQERDALATVDFGNQVELALRHRSES